MRIKKPYKKSRRYRKVLAARRHRRNQYRLVPGENVFIASAYGQCPFGEVIEAGKGEA